jgi:hypothetical protein
MMPLAIARKYRLAPAAVIDEFRVNPLVIHARIIA